MGLVHIGDKHLMAVIGGYDMNIHVYLIPRIQFQSADSKIFKYKFSLLGHINAIRGFDFTGIVDKNIIYMASCSQDHYIRLWKVQPLENISE
jgi:WD40 repeat protein